ncbi:MAG: transposase [Chloroflexi bacterium]|nr:transposase [Chloroflexota bacterium]
MTTSDGATVVGGVDCHSQVHHAVAIDDTGRRLGVRGFPATSDGYADLLGWLRGFGTVTEVGVESTGSYGAARTRLLLQAEVRVVGVNQPHVHLRRRRGKTDAVDAEAAVRKVLSGEATAVPKEVSGAVEAIRQLRITRRSAVSARPIALCQLGDLIVTAPAALRARLIAEQNAHRRALLNLSVRPIDDPVWNERADHIRRLRAKLPPATLRAVAR